MKRRAAIVLAGRVVTAIVLLGALSAAFAVAFARGGGADPAAALPGPPRDGGASSAPGAPSGADLAVVARFTEELRGAQIDAPGLSDLDPVLAPHWRKLRPPFAKVPAEHARLVSSFSLRTSEKEEQHAVATQGSGSGSGSWRPDVRLWNMNEGSFDQRESLVVPVPASIKFPLTLPDGAKVTFGAGSATGLRHTLVFRVGFVPTAGAAPPPCETRIPPSRARAYTEVVCDLSAFAGAAGAISLSVTADEPRPDESTKRPRRTSGDGGAPEDALESDRREVALFGQPLLLGRVPAPPYNVLWIVVDALRPDVAASFHDDARDAKTNAAELAPLDALLPKVEGLLPAIDALAKEGTVFRSATSAASWTRPGTLAMLAGARSSEVGIETKNWVLDAEALSRFYASDPPLLPLQLRRRGYVVSAFVNNYFLVGYTPIGLDMAFGEVMDHRYRTRDTAEITKSAKAFLAARRDERFFAFVNYNSPHDPYDPPPEMLARVPEPPRGPKDPTVRRYMAEAAKDDAAIGELVASLRELGLRDKTLVVVTADHGETLSAAHQGKSPDGIPIRFHHSASNFEETTRIPILLSLPKVVPDGAAVDARVRSTDIAPTVLDVLGLESHRRMSGSSLLPLAKGGKEPEGRVAVTEGRGTRSILYGTWHFLVYDAEPGHDGSPGFAGRDLLFDLASDPGERRDLAAQRPEIVAEMRARLAAALHNVIPAGSQGPPPPSKDDLPYVHVRFVGGGRVRKVSGKITIDKGTVADQKLVGIGAEAVRRSADGFEIDLLTAEDEAVGFDLLTSPPSADIAWTFSFDDTKVALAYGGPFGIARTGLEAGIKGEEARRALRAVRFPEVDPRRDDGVFVARDRGGASLAREGEAGEGAAEMARMLREWGYANGPSKGKK